jgi:hypothetical protein
MDGGKKNCSPELGAGVAGRGEGGEIRRLGREARELDGGPV